MRMKLKTKMQITNSHTMMSVNVVSITTVITLNVFVRLMMKSLTHMVASTSRS